jgi:hypothetical protein
VDYPKALPTSFSERAGVTALAEYANNYGIIWRETPNQDFGIDGQLEFVNTDGRVPGIVLAAQVKAGTSYFSHAYGLGWRHPIEPKHRGYWETFPIPVILFLHNPETCETYWIDVRQALRSGTAEKSVIVPKQQRLTTTGAAQLFETAGVPSEAYIEDVGELLEIMINTQSEEVGKCLSYLDMFALGLTNIARSLYFGTDIAMSIMEYNFATSYPDLCMPGPPANFMLEFAKFLVSQNLVHMDWSDFMVDWYNQELIPTFLRPLTSRGRALKDEIHKVEGMLVSSGLLSDLAGLHVAQEGFVQAVELSHVRRLPLIAEFQRVFPRYRKEGGC